MTTVTTKNGQMVRASDEAENIGQTLEKYKSQMALVLPRTVSVDRMVRIAVTTIRKTPALLSCNRASLFGAIMSAAQLNLEVDPNLGHAYLVPYGKEATLIVGYKGLCELARRSGQVSSVEARVVYDGDAFDYSFGLTPSLKHKPCDVTDPAKITHAYAVIRLRDGGVQYDVMTRAEIDAIRNRSRAKGGPWATDFAEMAKKTVLRRLLKLAPMSVQAQQAIALDELADAGASQSLDVEWKTVTDSPPPTDDVQDVEWESSEDADVMMGTGDE